MRQDKDDRRQMYDGRLGSLDQYAHPEAEDLKYASGAKYDSAREAYLLPKTFWEEVSDFLLGRTYAGKVFQRIAATIIGLVTGINVDPIMTTVSEPIINGGPSTMDINWIELVLMVLSAGIGWITARGIIKGFLNEFLLELQDVVQVIKKAREAVSPGGEDVTEQERQIIMQEAYDCVMLIYNRFLRSWVARLFGLNAKDRNQ